MCSQFKSNAKLAFIRICKVCLRKYRCNNLTTMDNVGFTQICIHIYRTVNRCGNFYIFIQRKIGICLYGYLVIIGTPVSNSMTELYTMMRYLQTDLLKECDINHFDEWAADFGEVKIDYEHISLCSKMICVHFYFSHERRLHISVGLSESALLPINL